MSSVTLKTSFELEKTIEAFYTGGKVQIDSKNEKIFCTCGDKITVINTESGHKIADLVDDEDDVTCFAVAPDSKTLISASKSLLNHQFDVTENKVMRRWKTAHRTPIASMVFDHTSTLLATGSSDTTIKVYDITKQYYTHSFKGSEGTVGLLAFHPDRKKCMLFSASTMGKIRMWDLQSSKCLCIFEGHFSQVTGIVFSSDSTSMISAGRDKVIIVWDLLERKQKKTVPVFECIESLTLIPTPKFLKEKSNGEQLFVTAGETGCLRAWELDGKCVYADSNYTAKKAKVEQLEQEESLLQQVFYDESSASIVGVSSDQNIIFYDVDSMKRKKQFIGYYDEIVDLKYFGENEEYVAIATNSEQIKLVHRGDSSSSVLSGHTATVLSLDCSFDGKYIASCSKDNSVRVWSLDAESLKFLCVAVGKGHTHHVGSVSWPKLTTDYIISGSQDLTLKCWKLPNLLPNLETVELTVLWTEKAHDKNINGVAVSPNDKLVVSASQDKTAKVWKLKSGKLLGALRGHKRGVWCAQFSPVDQCIATSSSDSTIKLWNISDFTCLKTLEGHANSVLRISFLNKGTQIVSSGSEGLIKLWNIKSDECALTLEGHDDKIWAFAVTNNGNRLVSGGADATIKFWKDVTEEKLKQEEVKEASVILREQELSNLLHEKRFDLAVGLAIAMQQPFRVLKIFTNMLYESGESIIEKVISALDDDQLSSLLSFMCDWNTNSKKSFVSQTVLSHILKIKHPNDLLKMTKMKEFIEALLPYTERHYERLNQLAQQSMFVDYAWEAAKLSSIP